MQRIKTFHTLQMASQLHGQGRLKEAEQLYKQQASRPGAQASEKDDNVKDGEVVDA